MPLQPFLPWQAAVLLVKEPLQHQLKPLLCCLPGVLSGQQPQWLQTALKVCWEHWGSSERCRSCSLFHFGPVSSLICSLSGCKKKLQSCILESSNAVEVAFFSNSAARTLCSAASVAARQESRVVERSNPLKCSRSSAQASVFSTSAWRALQIAA